MKHAVQHNESGAPALDLVQNTGEDLASVRPPFAATVATREMMQLRQDLAATLLELSQDAIIIRDADDRVTFWNRGANDVYGWTADEALSRRVNELLGTDPSAWASLNARLEQVDSWDGQLLQKRKDGRPILIHCREVLVRDANGARTAVLAIKRDITEQQRAIEALKEADRRKDEFLATLAHELRNPLAPIRNAVEIMRLAGDDRDVIDRSRDVLDRQARQLARIVEDLIDLARITEKKVEIRRERIEVRSAVETALEASRPQLEEGRLRVDVRMPDEPLYLDADHTRLSQVLVNLLNNAARHTPPQGLVTLIVERSASKSHDIGAVRSARVRGSPDDVVIRVRDTGSGIAASLLPHVFEMFTQGPRTTQQGRGGLGVGLALVRSLVELHGGTVEAHSAGPGEGSEFVVRLPLADVVREPTPQPRPAIGDDDVARKRVIVVDDNDDQVQSLAMLLSLMGHSVSLAHSGPEALDLASSFRPDVMLIDIGMPGMGGYEVARRVRELPGMGNVLLIAQTGWGSDVDRQRSTDAGFDDHLVKPVTPATLEEVMRAIPE
jgi:PAS domain S-box-containing protein